MKLLRSSVVATTLALSLVAFSTPSAAVCMGMACMYNKMTAVEGIDATKEQIAEALKSIHSDNAGKDVIIMYIKEALKLSKEINANDKLDRNRNRANGYLKESRKAVEEGDLAKATENLQEADKRFSELKGMVDLTQADRVSQQTNLLNRIMDTHDPAAGARK